MSIRKVTARLHRRGWRAAFFPAALPSLRRTLTCLVLVQAMAAPLVGAESAWTGLDTTSYRLERQDAGYRLMRPGGDPIPILTEWLEPAGVREYDEFHVGLDSLLFTPEVTAFSIGSGRVGLHLASYDIQKRGSMQAAVGRDFFFILDPKADTLIPTGPYLGQSRGRSRVGGCFHARFHHISLGDVDCDRYLDLVVVREEIICDEQHEEWPTHGVYTRSPMHWYRQQAEGWVEDLQVEGRLPCAGLVDLPLLAVGKTPVDFVLDFRRGADPLPPGEPAPFDP